MSMSGSQQRAEIPPKRIHPNANPSENGHEPVAKQQQNYQVFPGRNHFFCRGRLMTSRAYWAFLVALLFLSVPSALFLAFTARCPWLWTNFHPAIPIVFAYLFILAITSMFKTSWTDPGIIPRNLHPTNLNNANWNDEYGTSYDDMWPINPPMPREVLVNGQIVRLKYCDTCQIYRPPRASHCRQCDNCVEMEDHHCIWLNNCIGRRNYRSFFVFVVVATIMCCYAFAFSFIHVYYLYNQSNPKSFTDALAIAPLSFVVFVLCFILLWSVGGLSAYHCWLVMRNVTTHEQLRDSVMSHHRPPNPYSFGNIAHNFWYVLCRPQPKSYIARRKNYTSPLYPHPNNGHELSPAWNYP